MSMEIPLDKPNEDEVNFVLGKSRRFTDTTNVSPIEVRTGSSTEQILEEKSQARLTETERTKDWTDIDYAIDFIGPILEKEHLFSETFLIKPNGTFNTVLRLDGKPCSPIANDAQTPAGLYRLAAEIQKKNPEYQFSFETDTAGQWMKYTVSKTI